jgi:hypothetical protein
MRSGPLLSALLDGNADMNWKILGNRFQERRKPSTSGLQTLCTKDDKVVEPTWEQGASTVSREAASGLRSSGSFKQARGDVERVQWGARKPTIMMNPSCVSAASKTWAKISITGAGLEGERLDVPDIQLNPGRSLYSRLSRLEGIPDCRSQSWDEIIASQALAAPLGQDDGDLVSRTHSADGVLHCIRREQEEVGHRHRMKITPNGAAIDAPSPPNNKAVQPPARVTWSSVMHKSFELPRASSNPQTAPMIPDQPNKSKAFLYFEEELARFEARLSSQASFISENKSHHPVLNGGQGMKSPCRATKVTDGTPSTSGLCIAPSYMSQQPDQTESRSAPAGCAGSHDGSFQIPGGCSRAVSSGSFKATASASGSFRTSPPLPSPAHSFRLSRCRSWSSGSSTPSCVSPSGSFRSKAGINAAMRFLHTPGTRTFTSLPVSSSTEPTQSPNTTRISQWGLMFTDAAHLVLGHDLGH